MPFTTCKLAPVHVSSLRRLGTGTAGVTLAQVALSRTTVQRRDSVASHALPAVTDVWLPTSLPGVPLCKLPDFISWFLLHPFWTLVAGTVLVTVVPRVTKALWRYIIGPVALVGIGFAIGKNPDASAHTARMLLEFGQNHPAAMSVAILAVVAILISPFVVPVVLTAALCVFLWNPKALTNMLPSAPSLPAWMIPGPLKAISSPKSWVNSLDSATQPSPSPQQSDSFNPIKLLPFPRNNPPNPDASRPPAADTPAQPIAVVSSKETSPRPPESASQVSRRRPDREPDLDTDFQVSRLAPERAVSLPSEPEPSEAASTPSPQKLPGPLRGLLGSLAPSSGIVANSSDTDASAAQSPQACAASSEPCTPAAEATEEPRAGLLQRARNLKPLEAVGMGTKLLQGLTPGAPSDVSDASQVPDEPGVEPAEAGDARSAASVVKERLGRMLPERLRPSSETGRELSELASDFRRLSPEERAQLLREGEQQAENALGKIKSKMSEAKETFASETSETGKELAGLASEFRRRSPEERVQLLREEEQKAENALSKIKSKVSEAKETLASEESTARTLRNKIREVVGVGAASAPAASVGQDAAPVNACKDGAAVNTDGQGTDEKGSSGLRAFTKRVRAAVKEAVGDVETDSQAAGQGCEGVTAAAAIATPVQSDKSVAVKEAKAAEEKQPESAGQEASTGGSGGVLSVISMLPAWLMFW